MEPPEDIDSLAEDWIALWQSEIAGLAADPELAEQWAAWAALGAAWMRAATAMAPRYRPGGGHDGTASPPWTAPPAAASGPRGPAGDGGGDQPARNAMAERLAELERRLADLEGGAGGTGPDPRGPRGRRPRG
ncbi:hypothetical protein [Neoroseomonas terrae]|uniref:hypothetical protein n=1 Tax=Neoroseomonas terrae TaxID=424799 RepID=UPI001FE40089|nr:hypothetical protein [Neoroseomonas terrae]